MEPLHLSSQSGGITVLTLAWRVIVEREIPHTVLLERRERGVERFGMPHVDAMQDLVVDRGAAGGDVRGNES